MKRIFIISITLTSILIYSCSKTSEDIVGGEPGPSVCDTVNMKYAADIVPILQNNCYSCHGATTNSGSEGIILEGYNNIHEKATNGTLIGVITHASGFPEMPKDGPKLPDCSINKIRSWINNGAQNN